MKRDFKQIQWDEELADDCRQLVRLAIREDLERSYDLTTMALVPAQRRGRAAIVARQAGVLAGLPAVALVLREMNVPLAWEPKLIDGATIQPETIVGYLEGPARDLLTAERVLLNLLGRLSGVASLTSQYVAAVAATSAHIYDTRKTTPGWRRLEKYAVRCGGGRNHRTGLFDAILIKDNHLAQAHRSGEEMSPSHAVRLARQFLQQAPPPIDAPNTLIEIEVDTLPQLHDALREAPDLVLLDNMTPAELREAVRCRDQAQVPTELEASGGITFDRLPEIARSGVERISVGALTHSAVSLDLGLDWE